MVLRRHIAVQHCLQLAAEALYLGHFGRHPRPVDAEYRPIAAVVVLHHNVVAHFQGDLVAGVLHLQLGEGVAAFGDVHKHAAHLLALPASPAEHPQLAAVPAAQGKFAGVFPLLLQLAAHPAEHIFLPGPGQLLKAAAQPGKFFLGPSQHPAQAGAGIFKPQSLVPAGQRQPGVAGFQQVFYLSDIFHALPFGCPPAGAEGGRRQRKETQFPAFHLALHHGGIAVGDGFQPQLFHLAAGRTGQLPQPVFQSDRVLDLIAGGKAGPEGALFGIKAPQCGGILILIGRLQETPCIGIDDLIHRIFHSFACAFRPPDGPLFYVSLIIPFFPPHRKRNFSILFFCAGGLRFKKHRIFALFCHCLKRLKNFVNLLKSRGIHPWIFR